MNQALRVALILAAFLGIFAAGAVLGGVVMVHFTKERFDRLDNEHKEERNHHQQEQRRLAQAGEQLRQDLQRQQQEFQQQRQQLQQVQQQLQQRSGPGGRALPPPEQFGPQLMQRYANQIRPAPSQDQRDKIRPMVNRAAEDLRRLRRDTAHSTELILQKLQDEIAAVLTPEQRDRFTDAIQRWRDAFQKYNAEQQQRQAAARLAEQQAIKRMQDRRQQQLKQLAPPPPADAKGAPVPAPSAPPAPAPTASPAPAPAPTPAAAPAA